MSQSKLTEDEVRVIKLLLTRGKRVVDIARLYQVSAVTIRKIRDGHTWSKEPRFPPDSEYGMANLTEAQVREIKSLLARGRTITELAIRYQVWNSVIYKIRDGHTWRYIEPMPDRSTAKGTAS